MGNRRRSCHSGNDRGFRSSVPGMGAKPKCGVRVLEGESAARAEWAAAEARGGRGASGQG